MLEKNKQSSLPSVIRKTMLRELNTTHLNFQNLLDSIAEKDLGKKHERTKWTVKDLLSHVTSTLVLIPHQIEQAKKGKGMLNMPKPILNQIDTLFTKLAARKETKSSLRKKYDKAHESVITLVKELPDDNWQKGSKFFGQYQTIENVLHFHTTHFKENAELIRHALKDK